MSIYVNAQTDLSLFDVKALNMPYASVWMCTDLILSDLYVHMHQYSMQ